MNRIGIFGGPEAATAAHVLAAILAQPARRVGLISDVVQRLGTRLLPVPEEELTLREVQRRVFEMRESECHSTVVQVSYNTLQWAGPFVVAVFMDGVFSPMRRLCLSPKCVSLFDADSRRTFSHIRKMPGRMIPFGGTDACPVRCIEIRQEPRCCRLALTLDGQEFPISTHLVGLPNAKAVVAAVAAAWTIGYSIEEIRIGVKSVSHVPGRMERVESASKFNVFVDGAKTPESLKRTLQSLRKITTGRIILVFGAEGERDVAQRKLLGSVGEKNTDLAILTVNNPRNENPLDIIRDVEFGIKNKSRYLIEPDRRAAIKLAISLARERDNILVAGKGHDVVQRFRYGPKPFDDVDVAHELLADMIRK